MFDKICSMRKKCNPINLEKTLLLAIEIAREGREGKKIGTLFVVGDEENVLARSRNMILDPLYGHPNNVKRIDDPDMRETIKELAQLDGAFIVSADGVVLSACRHINSSAQGIELPLGLGSRHVAAASISKETEAVSLVVSESSVVRIFADGKLVTEIIPELFLLDKVSVHLKEPYMEEKVMDLKVLTKENEL
ncbi:MAG: diadenylate cyclase [Thermodesulfobacteriota bacterium]|nr:diadenylate cyclase [Thermodesulfobacteriota bacterium]